MDKRFEALKTELRCVVCYEIKDTIVVVKKCRHRFCKECISKWITGKNIKLCPSCRELIPSHRHFVDDDLVRFLSKKLAHYMGMEKVKLEEDIRANHYIRGEKVVALQYHPRMTGYAKCTFPLYYMNPQATGKDIRTLATEVLSKRNVAIPRFVLLVVCDHPRNCITEVKSSTSMNDLFKHIFGKFCVVYITPVSLLLKEATAKEAPRGRSASSRRR